jgi:plastocyanin
MKIDITRLPVLEAVIGFFLVVLVITFVGAFAATSGGDGEEEPVVSETAAPTGGAGGDEVAVTMEDNTFDPDEITVPAGQEITFALTNDGAAIHNMRIAGADNEYDSDDDAVSDPELVNAGDQATLTWQSPATPGEVDFRCDFHAGQMTGTITVQ